MILVGKEEGIMAKKKKQVDIPKCVHCNKDTDEDHFCYGCKTYVCDECEAGWSVAEASGGGHTPKDHLEAADEE